MPFCWDHLAVQRVCFSNLSSSVYLKLLLFPSEGDFTLSFPPPPYKQDRYFGFADMCKGVIVFFNSCMSLPVPTPHLAIECSFLPQPGRLRGSSIPVRNGPGLHHITQQHPGGTADNLKPCYWTWPWFKMHVVKMIGIKQKHMVCSLQAELNTDGYLCAVIWVNEGAKLEYGWSPCCETDMKMKKKRIYVCLCCSCSAAWASPCTWCLTVTSWVVSSSAQCTICARSEAAHTAGAFFQWLHSKFGYSFPILFFNPILILNPYWANHPASR